MNGIALASGPLWAIGGNPELFEGASWFPTLLCPTYQAFGNTTKTKAM